VADARPRRPTDAERVFVAEAERWRDSEMAYAQLHATKPQTVAVGLNDSPAGLAAWIVEKFRRWSDCDGDVERAFSRDDLLTNLTLYWVTETIGSSIRLYLETVRDPDMAWGHPSVPVAMAMPPADMFPTPREWVERQGPVARWTDLSRGGHFPEWEVPEEIADDITAFFDEVITGAG
jgi:pimeloyl-ACP methyl ester carboxylesterase